MSSQDVYVRAMGDAPISIGTCFSLQALYNAHPDREKEKKLPVLRADALYINVRTLLRNIMNATETDKIIHVKPADYHTALKDEIREIGVYLNSQANPIKVYFYLPTYKSLHHEFGQTADLRVPSTDLQKAKLDIEKQTLGLVEADMNRLQPEQRYVNIVDMKIESKTRERAFILTHLVVDLLYTEGFSEVLLLESHTGRIKDESEWYTKLHAEASERIPFNKATLVFFGDSGGMFKAQHHKARSAVERVAEKFKWTYRTTKTKMLMNLKLGGEGHIETIMAKMFR